MPRLQFLDDALEGKVPRLEQQQQVEEEVGALADQPLVVAGHGGERRLDAFLADLLCDAPGPSANSRAV